MWDRFARGKIQNAERPGLRQTIAPIVCESVLQTLLFHWTNSLGLNSGS